jgi:hypothetical protein
MDQEPLVREWIDAARKFLDEAEKNLPVQGAFWLKEDEDSQWEFYVVTPGDRHGHTTDAERDAIWKAFKAIDDPNFSVSRLSQIGTKDSRARAALEMYQRYPTRIPIFRWREAFGDRQVQGLYLYPRPISAAGKSHGPDSRLVDPAPVGK